MIANLITTILVALGVATGKVSSNVYKGGNAFNNEIENRQKQNIKKAVSSNVDVEITDFTKAQEWTNTNPNLSYTEVAIHGSKYYVGDRNSPNNANQYLNIRNTIYDLTIFNTQSGTSDNQLLILFEINSYIGYQNDELELESSVDVLTNNQTYSTTAHFSYVGYETTISFEEDINRNLTAETILDLHGKYFYNTQQNFMVDFEYSTYNFQNISPNNPPVNQSVNYRVQNIIPNQTRYIVMIIGNWITYNSSTSSQEYIIQTPRSLTITGTIITNEINYEVIDVPNLMFTILTLPFAWYSTAFNLTIFPGTPYALNFGNLVMTIVAAMILLYLIRKIIK